MKKYIRLIFSYLTVVTVLFPTISFGQEYPGTHIVTQNGYENCIELSNETTRVVLEPNMGGRVLIYALHDDNILYVDPSQDGLVWEPGKEMPGPCAGRFDIGPEMTAPKRPLLWFGKWEGRITGAREAVLISQVDTATGVMLIREFKLAEAGSKLTCTQYIRNMSEDIKRYYHWSRTFVEGGGISITPLNPASRYPRGFLNYGPGSAMNFIPADEANLRVREGMLEVLGPLQKPKLVMDPYDGWLAYVSPDNLLFIKSFRVFPERNYGDMAAPTVSIWYNDPDRCEVEPLGPVETIEPGQTVSFTEVWYLYDYEFPSDGMADLKEIRKMVVPAD